MFRNKEFEINLELPIKVGYIEDDGMADVISVKIGEDEIMPFLSKDKIKELNIIACDHSSENIESMKMDNIQHLKEKIIDIYKSHYGKNN